MDRRDEQPNEWEPASDSSSAETPATTSSTGTPHTDTPSATSPNAPPHSDESNGGSILGTLARLFVTALLITALLTGGAILAPVVIDDLDSIDSLGDLPLNDRPAPSSEPPPAGERNPAVTDPDGPGQSSYDTDVETITSDTVEDFVHAEVNERRADHGIGPLEWDGTVASVSRAHSVDMNEREYFSHTNPDGEGPYDRFSEVDNYCRAYGENIAMTWVDRPVESSGQDEVVEYQTAEGLATGLVNQWMNSTEHREAILEEHSDFGWDRGGVGIYIAEDGAVYASHNFCLEW
ncbi:CAP domain-containing protein [Natrialba sp. SSL1]|uniref:CAP domain-containing protein n=1 Tax=Natrialba sp. SSL1 TaxID=1869245 RepID=UPI0008F89511|nr:CAP domain-containing protein [Natrialba sp. SSL1]OIB58877.1 serine protease [Natrialba sp. SSL1]